MQAIGRTPNDLMPTGWVEESISHKYGKETLKIDKYTLNLHKPIQNRNMKCKSNANFVLPRYT